MFTVNATGSGNITGGGGGSISTSAPKDFEVTPGTYSVAETVPAGWDKTADSCQGVVVGAGLTVNCTITNTKRGHLIVQKTTNPSGDPTSFSITASGSGSVTGGGAGAVTDALDKNYEVTPGTYSVAETVPAGWDQNSNTCFNVAVAAGATVTCEITNTKRGHIIVQKTTNPPGDPTIFAVNASGTNTVTSGASGSVTDATDHNYEVLAGIYSVSEIVPPGWDQTINTCVNLQVGAGQTLTCEITNIKRGHLIVHKATDPANDPTVFTINASGSGSITGGGAGAISTSTPQDYEVTPGTYSVAETVPAGWAKTADQCQGVVVTAGQTVNCTITNTLKGHLIVTKVTNPASDTTTQFPVTASGTGTISGSASRILIGNGSSTNYEVTAGIFSVAETVPTGWDLTGNTCLNAAVAAGQTVNCQITNTQRAHLVVHKATIPAGITTTLFTITASSAGGTVTNGAVKTLTAGGTADYEVKPGFSYSVTENVPQGWQLVGNTCSDIPIGAGQIVECFIVNGLQPTLTITKFARFANTSTKFSFNLTNGGTTAIDVSASTPYTNSDGSGRTGSTAVYLANGASYTLQENLTGMADWFLNTVSCTTTNSGGINPAQPQLVNSLTAPPFPRIVPPTTGFSVNYGDAVQCAYTNTHEATAGIYKLINGCDPSQGKGGSNGKNGCTDWPPFTVNLYKQDPVEQQDQGTSDTNAKWTVPLPQSGTFPAGYLGQYIFTPAQPAYQLTGPVGVPLSVCEMSIPDAYGAYNWTVRVKMYGSNNIQTISYPPYLPGQVQPDGNRLYNPDYFFSYPNDYNNRCINITIPVGADEFDILVNNVHQNGRMTGGGSVFTTTTAAGQPPIGTRVTHGFELHCDQKDVPNTLEINWDGGNRFHLELLTKAQCKDDPAIPSPAPPNATFDTFIGTGTGRLNGVAGATATWTFTDAGEPGVNDTVLLTITDKNNNVVLKVAVPTKLTKGNHQAHK